MRNRLLVVVLLLTLVIPALGCGGGATPLAPTGGNDPRVNQWYDEPVVFPILAGQNTNVGTVTVKNDLNFLYVTYQITASNWFITETHLAVADTLAGIPQTKSGNPIPGQFPYAKTHNPPVTVYMYTIPLNGWTEEDCLYVATHCVVKKIVNGTCVQTQTGWSGDHGFPGKNWALYFDYCIQGCYIDLPTDPVDVLMHYPGSLGYWSHDLSNVPAGYDVGNGNYPAWCIQRFVYAVPETPYSAVLYAVTDPDLPACLAGFQWDKINYVLNHKNGASISDIQEAIWHFTGTGSVPLPPGAQTLVNDADAYGDGYIPGPGDIMAVVVFIDCNVQTTFIEVEVGC